MQKYVLHCNIIIQCSPGFKQWRNAASYIWRNKMTPTNPFMNVDMTKFMTDCDPSKMADQFAKFAGAYKLPEMDVDSLVEAQRKNIEALTAANQAAVEGVQALATRQNEILQETLKGTTEALTDISKSEGIEDVTAKQAELLKGSFEKALGNMKEMAELVAKSNADTSKAISGRIAESLEEIHVQAAKIKKQKK